jgi:hypothetical protein
MASRPRLDPYLTVWHRTDPSDAAVESATGFVIETCQRALSIGGAPRHSSGFARYSGVAAYQLLLEVSTGLASKLTGETNVFGQIKRAWAEQQARLGGEHGAWVQQWFADTKAVRCEHLQNVGGQSYASLCRRFLALEPETPLIIVGGGDLAASMVSLFQRHPRRLFTRRQTHFNVPRDVAVQPLAELPQHIAGAEAMIVCIPPDAVWEQSLAALLVRHPVPLIHLGYRQSDTAPLGALPNWHTLTTLFALKREQDNVRSFKLAAARRACAHHAAAVFNQTIWGQAPAAQAQ